nr:uncharacterized mitochondrial protein AtMg00810-like [Tanacetum cinerariifolium]
MDLETAQDTTNTKLPILKQVAQIITNADGNPTTLIPGPITTEENVQKKNGVKGKKLQKIVSQLAILSEKISQEDLNLKFLRSLPSEWNTHVVVWRNKPHLDTMSFDDLYNNLKIVEQEVKGTATSSLNSSSKNMAFVSSPCSTNEVNTTYRVNTANTQVSPLELNQPNGSQLVHEDLVQIHEDDLEEMDLKWQLALLSMRKRKFFQKSGRRITINGSVTAGYDKSKVEYFNCHKLGHIVRECRQPRNQDSRNKNQDSSRRTVNVEETASKAMVAIDEAGFDWSYMADDEVPTNMALIAFLESEVKESPNSLLVKELVSDDKLEKKTVFPTIAKIEFVTPKQQEKPVRKLGKYAKMYMSQCLRGNQRNWNNQKSQQLGSDFVMYNKACFVCGSFDHVQANCNYRQRERVVSWNNHTRGNSQLKLQEKEVINSGCSRHMTKNMSYLFKHEEIDGGYVAFRRDPKREKIIDKGKICTDTECVVLSPDFKLLDESQVLLRVLRKNNMHSVNLKNFAPSGGIENLIDHKVKIIRCDNRTEFKNKEMNQFCEMKGIKREFSVARTPQQNGVAERKNRTLFEAARTMLADSKTPSLSFMRPFGCPVTILNTLDPLGKFDEKANEGYFVRYSVNSKAFRVFNSRTRIEEETMHITYLENKPNVAGSGSTWLFDIDTLIKYMNYKPVVTRNQSNGSSGKARVKTIPNKDYILLPLWTQDLLLPSSSKNSLGDGFNPSREEEKKDVKDPGNEDYEDNVVDKDIVYGGADDPNMPNLKENNYSNDDEDVGVEADMTNLDSNIPVSPILTTIIHKDHPVEQIIGDIHSTPQTKRMTKNVTNYAPRAWYETLSTYLLDNGFHRGQIDKTLFIKRFKGDILLVQVYVDDIIFGSTMKEMCTEFEKIMHKKFQMSSIGELTFFLGLQVTQKGDGIFISQDKYVDEILKKFDFLTVKTASTPMEASKPLLKDENVKDVDVHLYRSMIGSLMYLTSSRPDIKFAICACARFQVTPKVSHLHALKRIFRYLKGQPKLGIWYPKDLLFDLEAYTDSDYAGASLDRKSTTKGCQFLGNRLTSWQCKKQTVVANSTTESEYVAASNYYGQIMDFLIAHPIKYALTVSPTIYSSCIEQFWATAKVKHVNEEAQLHAKVDGKRVIISEASIRSDLRFGDEGDEAVYEEMYDIVERAATTANGLDVEQDRGIINKTQFMATLNEPSSIGTSSGSGPRRRETMRDAAVQTRSERISKFQDWFFQSYQSVTF